MDELDVIRKVLDSPSPTTAVTFRARNRLTAAMAAPQPSPGRRWTMGWALGGGVALAGLAAAALLVPTDPGAGRLPDSGPGTVAQPPAELSARDILLAAAGRAERAPAETGRYWHVRRVGVFGPFPVGAKQHRYDLVRRELSETWIARDPKDKSWFGSRELGNRPRSDADRQAWRAAGSPTHWDVEVDTVAGTRRLTMGPGKPTLSESDVPVPYLADLGGLDLAGLAKLPAEPAKLRAVMAERAAKHMQCPADSPRATECLFTSLSQLLLETPAPPKVRAAAFAVLADLPDVRSLGAVQDGEGRTGIGIQHEHTFNVVLGDRPAAMVQQTKIIVDPVTYRVLGNGYLARPVDKPDARPIKEANSVILTAEWTDKTPEPPAVP